MTRNDFAGPVLASAILLSLATMAAAQTPPTTTEVTKGDAVVTTSEITGEVEDVEGNGLVVKLSSGEVMTFDVPESRRFIVDGKELTVHELVPGTKLTATVTTTTTPVTVRTTTIKSGTVWHVMRNNVILKLENGEHKQFIVKDDTKFTINGNPAAVGDLKKGMVVYAERIVEEPTIEITTDTKVVGQAPAPAAAQAAESAVEPAAVPAAEPLAPAEPAPATRKAGSRVPLIVGLLLVAGLLVFWMVRRGKSGS